MSLALLGFFWTAADWVPAPEPVVAPAVTDSLGGKPERRRKSSKPPYIQANSDFWEARERYLASLQPEIVSEPEPQALPPVMPGLPETLPKQGISPLLATYRLERQQVIDVALPAATSMRQLRAAGERLIAVNARIAEQKRLQLAALAAEQAATQKAERRRKLARIRVLKRKAVLLAAAEVSIALSHMQRNY